MFAVFLNTFRYDLSPENVPALSESICGMAKHLVIPHGLVPRLCPIPILCPIHCMEHLQATCVCGSVARSGNESSVCG